MTAGFDSSSGVVRPWSWADAFPWLAGASGLGGVRWWNESIDGTDLVTRSVRLATISQLAIERLSRWTIGQIFPGLGPYIDLLQLNLPVRALNVLGRFNCSTAGQLMVVKVDDMMAWRQVGLSTIDAILQALADVSTSVATPTITTLPTEGSFPKGSSFDAVNLLEMDVLACGRPEPHRWLVRHGRPAEPAAARC